MSAAEAVRAPADEDPLAGLAAAPMLRPLLLRTFGRTGSTLLMQLLGTSARVCFEREYPFEHRFLSYVQQLARVASLPYEPSPHWDHMQMFQRPVDRVGALPYENVRALERAGLSDRVLASLWREYSIAMRAAAGLDPTIDAYYAEKAPERVCGVAHRLLRARSIYLLRDPRDELVSIMSFNRKRGFRGFGWREDDTEESFAARMIPSRRRFMDAFIATPPSPGAITVRYEDLVTDGAGEATRLSDWLGLALDYESASSDRKIRRMHVTSGDPARSVERWRDGLGAATKAIFERELREQLEALGYPLR